VKLKVSSKIINNKHNSSSPQKEENKTNIPLDELEKVAILYDSIRDLHKKNNPEKDQELARDFDQHLQRVMKNLYQSVQNANVPDNIKKVNGFKAKYDLYDICLTKLILLMEDQGDETSQILREIHSGVHNIISSFYDVYMVEDSPHITLGFGGNGFGVQSDTEEINKLNNTIEYMKRDIEKLTGTNAELKKNFDIEKREMQAQLESLESENKEVLGMLIKHSKGEANIPKRTNKQRDQNNNDIIIPQPQEKSRRSYQESPPIIPKTKEFTYSKFNSGKNRMITSSNSSMKRSYKGAGGNMGQTHMRNLSLKQIKDIINDIYAQKVKYDQKCEENKLPRETMEQYMYTYLNQRYGLKNLIIEWAASIINSIKKYSKEDHTVSLFGKILRNEWDEEFRFIQMHVQETLNSLLKIILKEKYPNKSEIGINDMYLQIWNGFVDDFYWARIIERMYDEQDWYTLEEMFRAVIQKRQQSRFSMRDKRRSSKRKMTREERLAMVSQKDSDKLLFTEFMKTVLDFQLKEHEKFLYKFIVVFKQIDGDNNGVVNEDEFIELVKRMRIWEGNEEEITKFLEVVDPYNNQEVTFSEIVHLFSAHMVGANDPNNPEKEIPILEKFAKDENYGYN